ncbi:MAG: hypothetical protein WCV68_00285 [Candidatus Paceibacterota bacterium]
MFLGTHWVVWILILACCLVSARLAGLTSQKLDQWKIRKDRLRRMADMPALFLSGATVSRGEAVNFHRWLEQGLKLPKAWGIIDREKFSAWLLDSGNRAKVTCTIEALRRGKLGMFTPTFDGLGRAVVSRVSELGFTLEDFDLTVTGVEDMVKSAKVAWAKEEARKIGCSLSNLRIQKQSLKETVEGWGFPLACEELGLRDIVNSDFWDL